MKLRSLVAGCVFFIGIGAAIAGCSQQPQISPCPDVEALPAAMLYPEPDATNVPTDAGVLVFAGNRVTVRLVAPGARIVVVRPTPLSSPLPGPIATPFFSAAPTYAEAVPSLAPATTYTVQHYLEGGCSSGFQSTGRFTTQ